MINSLSLKTLATPTFIQEITSQLHAMAQEGSEASVASSSPAPNWWPEMHTNPISPWTAMNHRWQSHSSSAASCEDQDMSTNISATSFTNASNRSGLSMDSSSADMTGEPTENQLWSQVLFSVGNGEGDLDNSHDEAENFLEVLSSKSLVTEMFNPACDYLKKLDSSWDQLGNHSNPVTSLEKQMSSYNNGTMMEPERLTSLSDLVSNWSLAPPNTTGNIPHFSSRDMSQIKHEIPNSPFGDRNAGYNLHQDQPSLLKPFGGSAMGSYQVGLNNSMIGLSNDKYCKGVNSSDAPWVNNARNLSDLISFGACLNKPAMEFRASAKPSLKGSEVSSDSSKKQGYETSSSTKGSGRGSGTTSDGKKKRSEVSSETVLKKSKHEQSSNASSVKIQPPKVKLGDRITTLQQIVSPFGKTDTASVLLEAIKYIRFLQEQVQLLSDPYLKSSPNKDHNLWEGLERKDKAELKIDLRSRGLCLVPVSCTPQVFRENTGPDYWTPTYRGCIYR